MERTKIFKSLVLVSALVLSLAFFVVSCKPKDVVPTATAVVPMTPAAEVPVSK